MELTQEIIPRKYAIENNLKFYFTGKPCKNGHVSNRYTSQRACSLCVGIKGKEYRHDNKDAIKTKNTNYYINNKIRLIAQCKSYRYKNKDRIENNEKIYRDKNKDKIHKKQKEYREKNKDKLSEKGKNYHKSNKEQVNKRRRIYYAHNKEKVKAQNIIWAKSEEGKNSRRMVDAKRKALKNSTEDGTVTKQSLDKLREYQDDKCYHCRKKLDFKGKNKVHLDHYYPLSKGGIHSIDNVVWSCKKCNLAKGSSIPNTLMI